MVVHRRQAQPGRPDRPGPSLRGTDGGRGHHRLLELQRSAGNTAVRHLIAAPTVVLRDSAAMGASGQAWVRLGSRGGEVETLQEGLNQVGTDGTPIEVTGRFDATTDQVVRQFQADSGIGVDGVVGPHTWEALDRHVASDAEAVATGDDHHEGIDRPTGEQLTEIDAALNPTSAGPSGQARDWDGRNDPTKRQELEDALVEALQEHLDEATPHVLAREAAKAAGNVLSTDDQQGAGQAAKRVVDDVLGGVASAAVLTRSQERAREAFAFESGVNLLDASDPAVRQPDPDDLAEWMADTDEQAQEVQTRHGFNRRRRGQGEPQFFESLLARFIGLGANREDLERYDQFGFAFAEEGPRVLSQTAIVPSDQFDNEAPEPDQPSPAERARRWATWQLLVHDYLHTLAHPAFNRAAQGNRTLIEGLCELFTREVLVSEGWIGKAKDDDQTLREEVEGGDHPGFDPEFVPDYRPGEYAGYLARSVRIVEQVGLPAVRSAFFLGHVHNIGLREDGSMIDPGSPDADQYLAPERVTVPRSLTSVLGVSILTGASESAIRAANPGLPVTGELPEEAYTTGLEVPGTSYHRAVASRSRTERAIETKDHIAGQHGTSVDAIVRANPQLNHRQPREGEWILIPVH